MTDWDLGGFHWAMFASKAVCQPPQDLLGPETAFLPLPAPPNLCLFLTLRLPAAWRWGPAALLHSAFCDSVEASGHFPPPHPHSHSDGQLTGFLALDPHPPGLCLE